MPNFYGGSPTMDLRRLAAGVLPATSRLLWHCLRLVCDPLLEGVLLECGAAGATSMLDPRKSYSRPTDIRGSLSALYCMLFLQMSI